jgi:hypothetical protein
VFLLIPCNRKFYRNAQLVENKKVNRAVLRNDNSACLHHWLGDNGLPHSSSWLYKEVPGSDAVKNEWRYYTQLT